MRYYTKDIMLYYFQMKFFKTRTKKRVIKDEYQRMVEKFGSEQLRILADKGLRPEVVTR